MKDDKIIDPLGELKKIIAEMDQRSKEWAESNKKATEEANPTKCDHGVTFDEEECKRLMASIPEKSSGDPALDFIMGPSSSFDVRKRWPRLHGACPKGCGFNGIAYASMAHYLYGDW